MRLARIQGGIFAALALLVAGAIYGSAPVRGADRADSPATLPVTGRPGADISDIYMFPSPNTSGNVVFVMNVNPGIARGQGPTTFLDPTVLYQMKFDNTIGAVSNVTAPKEDLVIQFSAAAPSGGTQTVFVYGPAVPKNTGTGATLLAETDSFTLGQQSSYTNLSPAGSVAVFAGPREDPFFFDRTQFTKMFPDRANSTAKSCLPASFGGDNTCPTGFVPGADTQAGTNVISLVVEMPSSMLKGAGTGRIAYWATTSSASGT